MAFVDIKLLVAVLLIVSACVAQTTRNSSQDCCARNTGRHSRFCDIGVVRYFYDNTSQKCQSYGVLTCSDSDICNYKTFEDCMKNCHH